MPVVVEVVEVIVVIIGYVVVDVAVVVLKFTGGDGDVIKKIVFLVHSENSAHMFVRIFAVCSWGKLFPYCFVEVDGTWRVIFFVVI